MLFADFSLSTVALILGSFTTLVQAIPPKVTTRQPTPSPLDFLDLKASSIYSSPGSAPLEECAAALDGDSLAFPHARFTRLSAGEINCTQRLVFKNIPLGYSFTIIAAEFSGYAQLNAKSYLDQAQVSVGYFSASYTTSPPRHTDSSIDLNLSYKYHGAYSGAFNLIMNLDSGDTAIAPRGQTSCATETSQPQIQLSVWLSSMHTKSTGDDPITYQATVSDVRVRFFVMWQKCAS